MKAWALLLVGLGWRMGACADPPRRPPTTYVPIARGPDTPPPAPGPLESIPGPLGVDPSAGTPVPVSSKSASADKPDKPPPPDPANSNKCFHSTNEGVCCSEPGFKPKKQGTKISCPAGAFFGSRCKTVSKNCP